MYSLLYVDDEPGLLEIAKVFLEKTGEFSVDIYTSAQDALNSGAISSCDAIISDYLMPETDGIAFLKTVRKRHGDIPFILFTGKGREEVVIQAINNGADFYLQKGGDPKAQFAELMHKIRQAIARRRAERSLVESEKRLSDIINFLPDATFAIDRSGRVIAWNRAIEEMTGVAAAEILGKGEYEYAIPFYGTRRKILIDLIFEPDDVIAKNYAHIIHDKDILIADTTLPRPKGRVVTLMGKASPLYDRNGNIVGAIESIRDITELKMAEEKLLHAKKDWETIFRAIGHPALVLDARNRIIDANDATLKVTGKSLADLKGKRCYEVFHAPGLEQPPDNCPFEQLKKTGSSETAETEIEALNGYYSVNCTPVYGADGKLEKVIHIAMDVTERRRVENALRQANVVMENSPVVLFRWKAEEGWPVAYVSQNVVQFGYSPEELLSGAIPYSSMVHPDDLERVALEVQNYSDEGTDQFQQEYRIKTRNGDTRWIDDRTVIERDASGQITHYQGIIIDITDRKKYETELRAAYEQITASEEELRGQYEALARGEQRIRDSEAEYRNVLRTAMDGFCIIDMSGSFIDVNDAFCTMLGYSRGEVLTLSLPKVEVRETPEEIASHIREIIRKGEDRFETKFRRKDGRIIDTEVSVVYTRTNGGRFLTFSRDITDRKTMEKTLRESEEKYRSLVEVSPVAVAVHRGGTIIYVNPEAVRLAKAGCAEDLVGKEIISFIHPDYRQKALEDLRRIAEEGRIIPLQEEQFLTVTGEPFTVEVVAKRILYEGLPSVLVAFRDITERKKAEEALRETGRRLQEAQEMAHLGFWTWDVATGQVEWSDEVFRIFGLDPKKFTPQIDSILALSPWPEEQQRGAELIRKATVSREPGTYEQRFLRPDKSIGYYYSTFQGRYDDAGNLISIIGTVLDITERKKTEEALRESEQNYRLLFETASEGILVAQGDRMVYVNAAMIRLLGYPEDVITSRPFTDFIHPDDRELVLSRHLQRMRGEAPPTGYIFRIITQEGQEKWVRISSTRMNWSQKPASLSYLTDVTEQKKAEERLIAANREYIALLDQIQDVYYRSDNEGRLVKASQSWAKLLGYNDVSECIGKSITDEFYINPADRERFLEEINRNGKVTDYEILLKKKDGTPVLVETSSHLSFDSAGNITGIEGTFRDITDRKNTEKALRESEIKFRAIVDHSFEFIGLLTPDGALVEANESALAFAGISKSEVLNRPFWETPWWTHSPELQDKLRDAIIRAASGETVRFEVPLRDAHGQTADFDFSLKPVMDPAGRIQYLIPEARDITAQKRAEEALEKRLIALTQPLEDTGIAFEDLFNIEEIQRLQDEFAKATGVAVLLTRPDGTPITRPSNFCRLCGEIVRSTETGRLRCQKSDSVLGEFHEGGPFVHTCLSAGLWGAGASIVLGGRHIANWLIGQVRNEAQTEEGMRAYARELGVDEEEFIRAFLEVPVMSPEQFGAVAQSLYILANQLSRYAYQNVQQARFITERKKAEKALRESEERYRLLVENIPFGITLIDAEHRVILSNAAQGQMFHTDPGSWVGKYCYREFEKRDAVCPHCPGTRAMATGMCHDVETAGIRDDGTRFNARIHAIPLPDPEGRITGFIEIVDDITERKKAEEALRESEEKYRALVEATGTGFVIIDERGKVLDANQEYVRLTGHATLDEIAGRSVLEWTADYEKEKNTEAVRQCLRDGFIHNLEIDYTDASGTITPIEINATVLKSGDSLQILTLCRDITDRKRVETELREKTEELDRFFTASLDLFCIADTDGYFRRLNPEWERTLGYSLAELEGHRFLDFVHPDDQAATLAAVSDLRNKKEVINFTNRYRHKNGEYRWIEWRSYPTGNLIFAAARDITARHLSAEYTARISALKQDMLGVAPLEEKLKKITDCIVDLFGAEFARIWINGPGDLCNQGCVHALVAEGPAACQDRTACLHLVASSGRYTHIDEGISRVPYGVTSIGNITQGNDPFYITNDVAHDTVVRDHEWAVSLGLVSFAGFKLVSPEGKPIGILALFSRQPINTDIAVFLEDLATTASQVIGTGIVERTLAESEEKYRTLIEQSQDGVAIVQDERLVFANRALSSMIGYFEEEILGHPIDEFLAPEDLGRVMALHRERMGGGQAPSSYEFALLHKDGKSRVITKMNAGKAIIGGKPAMIATFHNITKEREREEALRESEARLRSILRGSPVLQFVIDRNHKVISWNKAIEEYSGIKAEEILGTDQQWRAFYREKRPVLADLLVDGRIDLVPELYAGKYSKSELVEGAYEATDFFPEMGISGIWLHFTAAPIVDPVGTIIGSVETLEDITERQRAEESLKKSEEQYKQIFKSFIDIYYETDRNGIITVLSPSVYPMSGWKPEDLIGKPVSVLYVNPSERQVLLERLKREHAVHGFEVELKKRDGTPIPVSVNAQIRYNPAGEPDGITGSIRDITNDILARKKLQESERQYRSIIENIQDAFIRTNRDGQIIIASPSAATLTGYGSVDEMIGTPFLSLFRFAEDFQTLREMIMVERHVRDYEVEFERKDGSAFWVAVSAHLLSEEQGSTLGLEGIVRDISERRRMENAIREANRKLNLLNSVTRHDVANQLTALRGYTQIASIRKPEPVIADLLAKIDAAAATIASQIEFTKIYQEMGLKAPAWFQIEEVVTQAGNSLVKFSTTCRKYEIFADPMLGRVFFNLFDNSVRHGEKVTAITVRCERAPGGLVIIVEDDGIGILSGEKEKIFEKGFGKNTGFGLFLAREVLSLTGITIRETGIPGRGARFEILVPKGLHRFVSPTTPASQE
ncbi:MAG: sensory histidine kinase AtoS [Methanoregula sp. PtaU1.Bin051]|nr:MAG: sensory histidine kinase AtoS [Methanoregula sp. PtaU1.Bin051]